MIIGDIMTAINAGVTPDDILSTVITLMRDKRCSCVIISEQGYPKGILTERDVVRIFADTLTKSIIPECPISEVMTPEPVCVKQSTSLYDALLLARSRKLRHLLVVGDDDRLVGLVTQTDMADAYVDLLDRQTVLESENQQLQLLSYEDALMKIGNRRAMEVELEFTEASAKRYNKTYAIALIDVDFFKNYNDSYGHQLGDNALQALAKAINDGKRDADRVYRYGGEEVLLLMPETNTTDALVAAERVRTAVLNLQLPHEDSHFDCLTISIGVAAGGQGTWQQIVAKADDALYKAKDSGRNKVIVAR
jgi:diguanylate cyclase (GGDEF)-like protein